MSSHNRLYATRSQFPLWSESTFFHCEFEIKLATQRSIMRSFYSFKGWQYFSQLPCAEAVIFITKNVIWICSLHKSLWRKLQFSRALVIRKVYEIKKFPSTIKHEKFSIIHAAKPTTLPPCFRFKCRDIAIKWFPHSSATRGEEKLHFQPSEQCLWIYLSEWWKKLFAHESLIAKLLENWIFIITHPSLLYHSRVFDFVSYTLYLRTQINRLKVVFLSEIITPSCVLIDAAQRNIDWKVDVAAVDISDYHINSMRCWWWSHFVCSREIEENVMMGKIEWVGWRDAIFLIKF